MTTKRTPLKTYPALKKRWDEIQCKADTLHAELKRLTENGAPARRVESVKAKLGRLGARAFPVFNKMTIAYWGGEKEWRDELLRQDIRRATNAGEWRRFGGWGGGRAIEGY